MEKLDPLTSVYPGLADVPVPAMSALLKLYTIIDNIDYLSEGLNIKKMGIEGMNVDEIVTIMDYGF